MYNNHNNQNDSSSSSSSSSSSATQSPATFYQKELYFRGLPGIDENPDLLPSLPNLWEMDDLDKLLTNSIWASNALLSQTNPAHTQEIRGRGDFSVTHAALANWIANLIRRNNKYKIYHTGELESSLSLYDRLCRFKDASGKPFEGNEQKAAQARLKTLQMIYSPHEIFYACLVLAYKHIDDKLMDNHTLSNLAGIHLPRLNDIEEAVFWALDHTIGSRKAVITAETLPNTHTNTHTHTHTKRIHVGFTVAPVIVPPVELPDLNAGLIEVNIKAAPNTMSEYCGAKWS